MKAITKSQEEAIRENEHQVEFNDTEDIDDNQTLENIEEIDFSPFFMIENLQGELDVLSEESFLKDERNNDEPDVINFDNIHTFRNFIDHSLINTRNYEIRIPCTFYKSIRYDCRKSHPGNIPIKIIKIHK